VCLVTTKPPSQAGLVLWMADRGMQAHPLWKVADGLGHSIFWFCADQPLHLPHDLFDAARELVLKSLAHEHSAAKLKPNIVQTMMQFRFLVDCLNRSQDFCEQKSPAVGLEPFLGRTFVPPSAYHGVEDTHEVSSLSYCDLFHDFTRCLQWSMPDVVAGKALVPVICSVDLSMAPSKVAKLVNGQLHRGFACGRSVAPSSTTSGSSGDNPSRVWQLGCSLCGKAPYGARVFVLALVEVPELDGAPIAVLDEHVNVRKVALGCIHWLRPRPKESPFPSWKGPNKSFTARCSNVKQVATTLTPFKAD